MDDLQQISRNVRDGTFSLRKSATKRSEAWNVFRLVYDKNVMEVFGVACCSVCSTCIFYKKRQDDKVTDFGTKNLLGHKTTCAGKASCSSALSQTAIKSHFPLQNIKIGKELAEKVKIAQVRMVCSTFSSFKFVDNDQFRHFAEVMMEVGSRYGKVPATDVLFGRKTIQKATVEMVDDIQSKIKAAICKPAQSGGVSFVTDIWTDSVVQNSYLEITFYWIQEEGDDGSIWVLKRAMYQCRSFPLAKTGENIEVAIDEALSDAGLVADRVPVTTDKGSNIVAATIQKLRVDCACHRLHTAISHGWNSAMDADSELKTLDEQCHKLVQFAKKSAGIQSRLPTTLKQGGTTRPWRAILKMLGSIHSNVQDESETLAGILRERKKEGLLSDIDQTVLADVYSVMTDAESVFDMLECATTPTISNVLPAFYLLRNTWSPSTRDSAIVRRLKAKLVEAIDLKMWPSLVQVHFAATFLDPSLKQFLFCKNASDRALFRQQAIDCSRSFCKPLNQHQQGTPAEEESTSRTPEADTTPKEPPAKAAKRDIFAAFRTTVSKPTASRSFDSNDEFKHAVNAEISRYEGLDGPEETSEGRFDPLRWWGSQRYRFPLLSNAARQVLVIQGSSAESERHFSVGGKMARKDRARLAGNTLEAQMMVAEALKKEIL